MSGDTAPGAAASSSTPSSSTNPPDSMASVPPSSAPVPEVAVKAAPASSAEEVPPPETTSEAPRPAAESELPRESAAPEDTTPAAPAKAPPATSAAPDTTLPADLEALPQPQAPPVAPPTYESEEIVISATDAPAIITTTTTPPTMTSALAGLSDTAPAAPEAPAPAAAPTIVTAPTPLALHPIRSSSAGGLPLGSLNPNKHAKLSAKVVPNEKPVEAVVVDDNDSPSPSAKKPLTLLELPNDILRLIVKEITHTNDLTSLALTNSTLYNLAVPHIYSRFDIVWPDPAAPVTEGKSVDALTYGLSTLCLGSAFARTAHRLHRDRRTTGPKTRGTGGGTGSGIFSHHTKFGSPDYAKYTRKFSLGNGPRDWVAEYMISKESGKMLGTLVALCVAKMQNLENFVWDMPTGVVSDVFMALASLPDFDPEHDACKLDRLWIRWHNNSLSTPPASPSTSPSIAPAPAQLFVPQGSNLTPIGILLPPHGGHPTPRPAIPYASSHVEFPTFSVVPPLRNLTVLDIDEVAYLDELAVLIERSRCRLTELRIGIAAHAISKDFVQTWDGSNLQQVDLDASWPGESTIGERRLGGVLGILVGRIYDIRRKPAAAPKNIDTTAASNAAGNETNGTATNTTTTTTTDDDGETTPVASTTTQSDLASASPQPTPSSSSSSSSAAAAAAAPPAPHSPPPIYTPAAEEVDVPLGTLNGRSHADRDHDRDRDRDDSTDDADAPHRLDKKLRLTTLELERVPLSMQVLVRAVDWTTLTTLTILSCPQHDSLWRQLKKHFRPTASYGGHGFGIAAPSSSAAALSSSSSAPLHYHMALKSIHTDIVSKALLSFVRDTLAPNSLEVLFLQNRRHSDASTQITVQDIFKSAIKPHRASLQKLLIDGNLRTEADHLEGSRRRRTWTCTPEILSYITSGRMTNLRELAFTLNYANWHTFLQRLPQLPQLRSLHVQHIVDHVVEPLSPYDLAMQVADIVTLRPEVQLCFVGIGAKCYEVVELHGSERDRVDDEGSAAGAAGTTGDAGDSVDGSIHDGTDTSSSTSDDDEEDEDDDDDDSDEDDHPPPPQHHDFVADTTTVAHAHDSDADDHSDSGDSDDSFLLDGETAAPRPPRLQMREIFFYDDKVAIFKARHGRL